MKQFSDRALETRGALLGEARSAVLKLSAALQAIGTEIPNVDDPASLIPLIKDVEAATAYVHRAARELVDAVECPSRKHHFIPIAIGYANAGHNVLAMQRGKR